jgi:hypothetical protein
MRYLKTFENLEKFSSGVSEIETFIKNNLAYILDEGFTYKVNFKRYGGKLNYPVKIVKIEEKGNNRNLAIFNWDDVKDDLIPFLELLNDTYTLDSYSPEDKSLVIDTGEISNWDLLLQKDPNNWMSNDNKPTYETNKRWYSIEELIDDVIGNHIQFQFISFTIKDYK